MPKSSSSLVASWVMTLRAASAALLCVLAAGCGGGADAPPPPEGAPTAAAPVITQQPAPLSVTVGQAATFTVAATGTAPLAYQWQRNGTTIDGATDATYTLASAAVADSGALFRAVVSNSVGSATSNDATLTVVTAGPVLTITQQPADASVVAGSTASFTVAATCSSGTLNIQWQRNSGTGGAFVTIDGATAASYVLASTGSTDTGARFQAVLDCSGQSTTNSQAATLAVNSPGSVRLDAFPIAGLREQALIGAFTPVIDQEASGSYVLVVGDRIKRLSADLSSITLLAGGANPGAADGVGAAASFSRPVGLAHDAAGNVYVADTGNNTIRRIAPDGTVTTLAGGDANNSGNADGTGSAARFNAPSGMAVGPDGDLYVADSTNSRIRRVTTGGVVTTYAGSSAGYADAASPLAAQFLSPSAVAVAANGDVLVADSGNSRIRRILRSGSGAGAVQTLAGSGGTTSTDPTSPDGTGTAAVIFSPTSLALRGNVLTVSDSAGLLRQVDLTSAVVTTLTGSHAGYGYADGPPSAAQLSGFGAVTTAANGGFLIYDAAAIRLVSASGNVSTIANGAAARANNSDNGSSDGGTGLLAQLPLGVSVQNLAVDSSGRVIIGDGGADILRRIDASGQISLLAGLAYPYMGMVDGVGSAAQFSELKNATAQDNAGNLYVGDYAAVRKIAPDGTTTLLAGGRVSYNDPTPQFGAVDGNATTARFNMIGGLAVGPDGAVYVSDFGNNAVRRIDTAGNVTTYAGVMGQSGSTDGPIASARFRFPASLAFGSDGSLYVSDSNQLRRISADGSTVTTLNVGFVGAQVFGSDGTMYFANSATGLWSLSPGSSTPTLLIAGGVTDSVVLGSAPHLSAIAGLAVYGPKQLLVISGFRVLKVTLP